jgi:hypothetical protein
MNDHRKFEILCALIVVGQGSDADLRELGGHVQDCVDCQNRIADFAQISAQALPLSAERYNKPRSSNAMTARFVERARAQGIPLQESDRLLPTDLSSGLPTWNRHLAAALLLVAVVAGGISKSIHGRAPSTSAKLEFPNAQSEPTRSTQQQHTKRVPAPRSTRTSHAGSVRSVVSPTLPDVQQESHSYGAEQVLQSFQYAANRNQGHAPFNVELFPAAAKSEHSRLLQLSDPDSGRPWFDAPSLMSSLELAAEANDWGTAITEHRPTFAMISLNSPPPVFRFLSGQGIQSDTPHHRSESIPSIDWYQVWPAQAESLRHLNDPPESRPGVFAPLSPFSQEFKEKQP